MTGLVKTAGKIHNFGLTVSAWMFFLLVAFLCFVLMPIFIAGFFTTIAFTIHPAVGVIVGLVGIAFLVSAAITGWRNLFE